MNVDTGEIVEWEKLERMREENRKLFVEMQIPPTPKQMARRPFPRVGRNDPCPCGSGKKFKRCHLGRPVAIEPKEVQK